MSNMKKVTVIIPCFHSAKYLPRLWECLKEQTIGIDHLQCVFVDDASEDDGETWGVLEKYHNELPESVQIIRLSENLRRMRGEGIWQGDIDK